MTPDPLPAPLMVPPISPHPDLAEKHVRTWSMLCHLSALCGLILPSFGAVIGPLVVWLIQRNDHPTIDANGKESLNFQLSMMLYSWGLGILGILTTVILIGFVFLALAFVAGVISLVLAVVASIKVSNGDSYHYPLTIRFLN